MQKEHYLKNNSGFTLVEAMMAMLFFVIVGNAIITIVSETGKTIHYTKSYSKAGYLATNLVEEMKLLPFNDPRIKVDETTESPQIRQDGNYYIKKEIEDNNPLPMAIIDPNNPVPVTVSKRITISIFSSLEGATNPDQKALRSFTFIKTRSI